MRNQRNTGRSSLGDGNVSGQERSDADATTAFAPRASCRAAVCAHGARACRVGEVCAPLSNSLPPTPDPSPPLRGGGEPKRSAPLTCRSRENATSKLNLTPPPCRSAARPHPIAGRPRSRTS
jgi:hypothetical protein